MLLEAKTNLDTWDEWSVITAPSSPVHNRRLLSARNMRMSSVELPDENEKSLSSASTSPCPSPVSMQLQPVPDLSQHDLQPYFSMYMYSMIPVIR